MYLIKALNLNTFGSLIFHHPVGHRHIMWSHLKIKFNGTSIFHNTSYLLQESFSQTIKVFLAVVAPLQFKWPILLSKLFAQLLVRIFLSWHNLYFRKPWLVYLPTSFCLRTFTYALTFSSRLSPISHKYPCFLRGK